MSKKNNYTALFLTFALISTAMLILGINTQTTGQSIGGHTTSPSSNKQVTATGSFGGLGNGRAKLSFTTNGGPATGTFSGEYESGPIKAIYNGQLNGRFTGGEGGTITGQMSGRGQILSGTNQQGWQQIAGTFQGTVNFAKGIVTGNWHGGESGGAFNLRFNPIKGVPRTTQTSQPTQTPPTSQWLTQYGVTTTKVQAPLGYCKCRTSRPYIVGVGGSPYGTSEGLEFKGFMTYSACQNTCPGRYVWQER
ncbi:hypothetical protein KY304_01665 [Candidatus Woesearchaeota archaeon]|nr:hypothetical protein [Candidatus Woesearchaeota archaeon]